MVNCVFSHGVRSSIFKLINDPLSKIRRRPGCRGKRQTLGLIDLLLLMQLIFCARGVLVHKRGHPICHIWIVMTELEGDETITCHAEKL